MAGGLDLVDQRPGNRLVDIDEAHFGALFGKMLDDRGTDARTTAGDEDWTSG